MDLFISTFESIAMLIGIGCVGFFVLSRRVVSGDALKFISPLVIDVALPALVFTRTIQNFDPVTYAHWWQMPLWWAGMTVVLLALSLVFCRCARKETRREFAASLFYQNAIFFPIPIFAGMFGDGAMILVQLFFFTLFFPVLLFNTHQFFFPQLNGAKKYRIVNPVMIAVAVAVVCRYLGVHDLIPGFIMDTLSSVGSMTIPLLMIILGGNLFIDFQKRGPLYPGEVAKFVLVKNIIFPGIVLGLLGMFKLPKEIALLLLIESAVPPVTLLPVFTERAGGNYSIVNQYMLGSFLFSLISIPLMIALFARVVGV